MADRSLRFLLFGEDVSASKSIKKVGDEAGTVGSRVSHGLSQIGGAIGGEVGDILDRISGGLDQIGEGSKAAKIAAAGGAITGVGVALQYMASGNKQAEQQLKTAIEASGHSFEDYEGQIKKTIAAQEKFGHQDEDTQEALRKLTQATNDPKVALQQMGLVANLAAAQHLTLSQAADQVTRVLGGRGSRVLAQYGIQASKTGNLVTAVTTAQKQQVAANDGLNKALESQQMLQDRLSGKRKLSVAEQQQLVLAAEHVQAAQNKLNDSTKALKDAQATLKDPLHGNESALDQLSQKLSGQAAAASDTFKGKIDALKAKVTDWTAEMAGKAGPVLTALGPMLTVTGSLMSMLAARNAAAAASTEALTVAEGEQAVATEGTTVAQTGLNAALLANPITWVVLAIVALIAIFVLAYKHVTWFRDGVNAAMHGVKVAVGWLVDAVSSAFHWVQGVWPRIVGVFHNIVDGIGRAFSRITGLITAPFRAEFNAVAWLWNNTLGKISFKTPSWLGPLGNKGFSFPHIPMLASGGVVTRPTLALIGEAGPEAVVPLNRGAHSLGGGVTVVVQTPPGFAVGSMDQFANFVVKAVEQGIGRGTVRPAILATR